MLFSVPWLFLLNGPIAITIHGLERVQSLPVPVLVKRRAINSYMKCSLSTEKVQLPLSVQFCTGGPTLFRARPLHQRFGGTEFRLLQPASQRRWADWQMGRLAD